MLEDEFNEKAFADPAAARRDYRAMSEDELRIVARNRESAARFAWSPYMHDPKLRDRLHRIGIPTLVLWGTSDRLIPASHAHYYQERVPRVRLVLLEGAPHVLSAAAPEQFLPPVLELLDAQASGAEVA